MRRPSSILAASASLLMIAAYASGLAGSGRNHGRLGLLAMGASLAAYGAAFARLKASGRRVEALATRSGMPEWVLAQAEKNRRKAGAYLPWGLGLAGLSAGSGWLGGGSGHLVASASSLAFQAGASAGLVLVLRTQAGLLRDVEGWAREARPGLEP